MSNESINYWKFATIGILLVGATVAATVLVTGRDSGTESTSVNEAPIADAAEKTIPDPVVEEAIDKILAAGKATGKVIGMHLMDAAAAKRRLKQGVRMIGLGSEMRFTTRGVTDCFNAVEQ